MERACVIGNCQLRTFANNNNRVVFFYKSFFHNIGNTKSLDFEIEKSGGGLSCLCEGRMRGLKAFPDHRPGFNFAKGRKGAKSERTRSTYRACRYQRPNHALKRR